jgi:hypothetical protein
VADKQTVSSTILMLVCTIPGQGVIEWRYRPIRKAASEESLIKGHGPRSIGQACHNEETISKPSLIACCLGRTPEYSE